MRDWRQNLPDAFVIDLSRRRRKNQTMDSLAQKASASHNGITGTLVREAALHLGLVNYKICSLYKDWTGMLFALKKP